jgi:hypothetical protein
MARKKYQHPDWDDRSTIFGTQHYKNTPIAECKSQHAKFLQREHLLPEGNADIVEQDINSDEEFNFPRDRKH